MMNEHDVVDLLNAVKDIGLPVWLDGGWGVDALIGYQTRPHNDIDIFIEKKNASVFIKLLTSKGYGEKSMDYTTDGHTAWIDSFDRIVDLHLFEFGEKETVYFENEAYPSNVLSGEGMIGGTPVRCLTAEAQMAYHQEYEHTEKDTHDVMMLNKTFGLDIPKEYQNTNSDNQE